MSPAIRHEDLRRRNREMVIAAVRRAQKPSRTEIVSTTGLSHSTISAISADLIGEGILQEIKAAGNAVARRGRPQIALSLEPQAAAVVVAILSLNQLSAALIDYSGEVVVQETSNPVTGKLTRTELGSAVIELVGRLIEADSVARPQRIVLAVQGVTDSDARAMLWSPITPHTDIRFAEILEREFRIGAAVENDCNMIAAALRWRDPTRYQDDFAAILLSYGIGMGLLLKGELFTGTRSSGGEFGHMIHRPGGALCRCGRRGCLEAYACDYAIWRNAHGHLETVQPEGGVDAAAMQALAEKARAADGPEREAYRKAGAALGFGIGSLFALTDPVPVAFVGSGAAAFDLLEPALRETIKQTAGGSGAETVAFEVFADEYPLIRQGCAMQALSYVDREIFAARPG